LNLAADIGQGFSVEDSEATDLKGAGKGWKGGIGNIVRCLIWVQQELLVEFDVKTGECDDLSRTTTKVL